MTNRRISGLGWMATGLAVGGMVLNNYRLWPCFCVWIVSNAISAGIHLHARPRLWGLFWRDVIFLAGSIVGLWQWTR